MPFLKRLGFYLIGLSVGLVFLAFFLKKKSQETGVQFCYLPNCRVLKDLRSKPLTYSSQAEAELAAKNLDSTDILYVLNEGDVDFKKSDTKSEPCKTFIINATLKSNDIEMTFNNCREEVILSEIELK